jgi:hypothetical protein
VVAGDLWLSLRDVNGRMPATAAGERECLIDLQQRSISALPAH